MSFPSRSPRGIVGPNDALFGLSQWPQKGRSLPPKGDDRGSVGHAVLDPLVGQEQATCPFALPVWGEGLFVLDGHSYPWRLPLRHLYAPPEVAADVHALRPWQGRVLRGVLTTATAEGRPVTPEVARLARAWTRLSPAWANALLLERLPRRLNARGRRLYVGACVLVLEAGGGLPPEALEAVRRDRALPTMIVTRLDGVRTPFGTHLPIERAPELSAWQWRTYFPDQPAVTGSVRQHVVYDPLLPVPATGERRLVDGREGADPALVRSNAGAVRQVGTARVRVPGALRPG